jgi:hypothetical protein
MRSLTVLTLCTALSGCTLLNSRAGLAGDPSGADQDDADKEQDSVHGDGDGDSGDGDGDSGDGDGDSGDGDSGDGDGPASNGDGDEGSDGGVDQPVDQPDASKGPGPFVLFEDELLPTGIALHGDELCFVGGVEPRGLYCGPRDGGSTHRISNDSDLPWLDDAFDLGFDDGHVYWSNGKNNQVVWRSLSGGEPSEYFDGGGHIAYISLRDGRVFASNYGQAGGVEGHVIYGPRGTIGSDSQLIYPGEPHAAGVAIVNATVFWGTSDPDQLAFASDQGNDHVTRVNADGPVTGVAVDSEKNAYFITGNQRIYHLRPGSDRPDLLHEADEPFGTSDITLDESWLYWSERDHGRVMRMRRE